MYWADELVKKIPNKKIKHRVDDMKTVSGMPHVGSLRAVTTHDIVYKAMKDAGFNVDFTYVFNDMDPMDGLPVYLDEREYSQHMGKPLYKIPSPVKSKKYNSFGEYYATIYKEAFNKIGCNPKIIWSHEVYASGKMNDTIRICLDNADQIRKIYKKVAGQTKLRNWLPYQVFCPKCAKVGSTLVTKWDGKYVYYECKTDLVKWSVGCGHRGKVEPINENGKLMWKVDWAAHWKVLNVTVEGAGKEHFTKGGSRDIGVHICKEVLKTEPPFGFLHEFFLIGGSKMSSSKGTGIGADKITEIIPPYLVRFLTVRTPLRRAVNFDPNDMTIPDLFDAYDKAARAYWDKKDTKLKRIFELSQVDGKPPERHFLPRFRDVAKLLQDNKRSNQLIRIFGDKRGGNLNKQERNTLSIRIEYAKIWLKNYAPEEKTFQFSDTIPQQVNQLSQKQKDYLNNTVNLIDKDWNDPKDLQQALYDLSKKVKLSPKEAFSAIYIATLGKNYGPQAAWFLLQNSKKAIERFKQINKKEQK